jgi:hypothetical protein
MCRKWGGGGWREQGQGVRSLAVLTCECSETCNMAMHVVSQDDLISTAQFDLDLHQNTSSPQTECNSLLYLCPYIKHKECGPRHRRLGLEHKECRNYSRKCGSETAAGGTQSDPMMIEEINACEPSKLSMVVAESAVEVLEQA